MGNSKKWKALVLSLCMVMSVLLGGTTEVYAANNVYEYMGIELDESPMTIYTNQIDSKFVSISGTCHSGNEDDYDAMMEKILKDTVCTSSDESVVSFLTEQIYDDETGEMLNKTSGKINLQDGLDLTLLGVSPGTATITVKSNILNETFKFKVTVKDAGL